MIFVDSSGFIAAFDSRDRRHAGAVRVWDRFAERGERLLTTQLVMAETVTHLRRRGGWEPSRELGEALLRSRLVEIVGLSDDQLAAAWREFVRNPDPKLSLCDAASFIVMRERGVTSAFTFDRHFTEAGFKTLP